MNESFKIKLERIYGSYKFNENLGSPAFIEQVESALTEQTQARILSGNLDLRVYARIFKDGLALGPDKMDSYVNEKLDDYNYIVALTNQFKQMK